MVPLAPHRRTHLQKNLFGGRRWKRTPAAGSDNAGEKSGGKKSVFGGRWKRNAAKAEGTATPAGSTAASPWGAEGASGDAKIDGGSAAAGSSTDQQESINAIANQLDRLGDAPSKASNAEHPLQGKGSRDVFRQMSGVQKKALEILGKEAYDGLTEQWMTVMSKRTMGSAGDTTDGYSQPPNPLVPTGVIGKHLVQIAGGMNHTIVSGDAGEVLAIGENRMGQLGVVPDTSATTEKAKAFLEKAFGKKDGNGADSQDDAAAASLVFSSPLVINGLKGRRVFHVSCGSTFSAALTDAGEIFTWGSNEFGQLGHGDKVGRAEPTGIEALQFTAQRAGVVIVDIDCGADHMGAISFSKEAYTWGLGNFGNLGHGTSYSYTEPRIVELLQNHDIQQLSCGTRHTMAINKAGEVLTWGFGGDGRLGHGDSSGHATPHLLELLKGKDGLGKILKVCAGDCHSAALDNKGEVYTWGSGSYYKLGHGDITDRSGPRVVKQLVGKKLIDVTCGFYHTAVLTHNGVLFTWGGGIYGKLGHPSTDNVGYPQAVKALSGKRMCSVVATPMSTLVVSETGDLFSCGYGSKGALGHGEQLHEELPKKVVSMKGTRVAMYSVLKGEMRARAAQMESGPVIASGEADGKMDQKASSQIRFIASGPFHVHASSEKGKLFGWGSGAYSRLGFGDDSDVLIARRVVGQLERKLITMVGCGERHTVCVTGDGNEVFAWGCEGDGRLGLGKPDIVDPDVPPAEIQFPEPITLLSGQRITELAVGHEHTVVATENMQVYVWGCGSHGRLGIGNTIVAWDPRPIPFFEATDDNPAHPIKKIAAGGKHTLLIRTVPARIGSGTNNEVMSWGSGWWYRLGHGDQENCLVPKEISALSGKLIIELGAGTAHSAAVSSTGDVYTWGYGANGRLGHDDYHNQEEPRLIKSLRGVDRKIIVKISCGDAHTVAVTDEGKLVSWGKAKYGQLGIDNTNECQKPMLVTRVIVKDKNGVLTPTPSKERFEVVACGMNHTVLMTARGNVFTCGMGGGGRLGHGDLSDSLQPRCVEAVSVHPTENAEPQAKEEPTNKTIGVTLEAFQGMLLSESADTEEQVKSDLARLKTLKNQADMEKHHNATLEREIRVTDKKIKLLIKNKKEVQNSRRQHQLSSQSSPISTMREDYENLFYMLQANPTYLALLTSAVPEEAEAIVKTFTAVYGNQHDPREEHLMLQYFTEAMEDEFKKADRIQIVLGGASSIVRTINAYLRRESNKAVLVGVLGPPMTNLVTNRTGFELNPLKVYQEVCERNNVIADVMASPAQVMKDPAVMEALTLRIQMLRDFTKTFLDAVINALDLIPYGIRWLCKQILKQANSYFETSEKGNRYALIGSVIFLHWFNPAICFPESVQLVDQEIDPDLRMHFVLVTKVLHNIVHKTVFNDTQTYMKYINEFIETSADRVYAFLDELVDVEDLAVHKENVQYGTAIPQDAPIVRIFTNDIFTTHRLLYECLASVAPALDDPIRVVLKDLGAPPGMMPPDKNKGIELKLVSRFDAPLSDDSSNGESAEAILQETRWQLMQVIRAINPIQMTRRKYCVDTENLTVLLSKAKQDAIETENYKTADAIKTLQERLAQLALREIYHQAELVRDSALEMQNRSVANANIAQEQLTLQQSIDTARSHRIYLLTSVSAYRETLANARATAFNPPPVELGFFDKVANVSTLQRTQSVGPFRYSYVQLESDGVVLRSEFPEEFRPHLTFLFSSTTAGVAMIAVVAKQHAGPGLGSRDSYLFSATVILEDLLMAKEKKHKELDLREVVFELNLVVDILNERFFL